MSYLVACGRLNVVTPQARELFELVGPAARARKDVGYLTALAQLAAKLRLGQRGEPERVLRAACAFFDAGPPDRATRGYSSHVAYGQLLLALIFDEAEYTTSHNQIVNQHSKPQSANKQTNYY